MDKEKEQKSLELATYMLASARQLFGEPSHYGPIRLVEATLRFLCTLDEGEESPSWLNEVRTTLEDTNGVVKTGSQEYLDRLDGAIDRIASSLIGEL
ncbi:DUF6092 family protein [Candidatus Bipolaricaulota bacterium]